MKSKEVMTRLVQQNLSPRLLGSGYMNPFLHDKIWGKAQIFQIIYTGFQNKSKTITSFCALCIDLLFENLPSVGSQLLKSSKLTTQAASLYLSFLKLPNNNGVEITVNKCYYQTEPCFHSKKAISYSNA